MRQFSGLEVIKKDGSIEKFDPNKIIKAVTLSAQRVMIEISDDEFSKMIDIILDKIEELSLKRIPISNMHQFVECALDSYNSAVAKSYREYRNYKIDFVQMMNKVYEKSQAIRYIGDKENANADSALVATKRSLIYNELNKRLYRKFFMTIEERQACNDGYIYIHDQSARLDTVLNCCLFNAEEVMKGGFEMGNIWYNEPKTLDTAFDVLSDVILATAAQQYGGFTVPEVDKLLSYYAEKSYKLYYTEYINIVCDINDPCWDEPLYIYKKKADMYAIEKTRREFEQGWQGIEMKLNTVGSSRGDYPFITMTFGLATDKFGRLASKTFLKVHMTGQGKHGNKRPVLFPKLVFLYDKNLHDKGGINEDICELAIQCSSKTMYPDWLSLTGEGYVPEMYKKYGRVISPMGKCKSAHVKRYLTVVLSGCDIMFIILLTDRSIGEEIR